MHRALTERAGTLRETIRSPHLLALGSPSFSRLPPPCCLLDLQQASSFQVIFISDEKENVAVNGKMIPYYQQKSKESTSFPKEQLPS